MIEDLIFVQCHVEGVEVTLSGEEWGQRTHFASFWHVQFLFFGVDLGWKNSQSTMANWPIGIHSRSYQLVRCKLPSGFMFPTASTVWVDPKISRSKHILHARGVALMMKQLLLHIPWNEGKSGHAAHRAPIEMKPIQVSDSIGVPRLLAKWICRRILGFMKIHFKFTALNLSFLLRSPNEHATPSRFFKPCQRPLSWLPQWLIAGWTAWCPYHHRVGNPLTRHPVGVGLDGAISPWWLLLDSCWGKPKCGVCSSRNWLVSGSYPWEYEFQNSEIMNNNDMTINACIYICQCIL